MPYLRRFVGPLPDAILFPLPEAIVERGRRSHRSGEMWLWSANPISWPSIWRYLLMGDIHVSVCISIVKKRSLARAEVAPEVQEIGLYAWYTDHWQPLDYHSIDTKDHTIYLRLFKKCDCWWVFGSYVSLDILQLQSGISDGITIKQGCVLASIATREILLILKCSIGYCNRIILTRTLYWRPWRIVVYVTFCGF